ncbi:UbiA family prenyltransferase [Curtobacterium ammoniigenes]|uniref:UbiA family prenyltransferase n=1 Tax=Curtobacterium ammoniigenes TaxID=395387 RepID=UPI00082A3A03|nr:UbiA family prenyltransferase [Curtobacterium ammoniigenes]
MIDSAPATRPAPRTQTAVLCVDLDHTLIRTDLLWEAAVRYIAPNPLRILVLIVMVLRGRARLKQWLADRVSIDVADLPFKEPVLDLVRTERALGARTVLATASPERWAHQVAAVHHLMDDVIATSGEHNLAGATKAEALVARYGERGFVYVGDSRRDVAVWRHAARAVAVDADAAVIRSVRSLGIDVATIDTTARTRAGWRAWVRQIRIHQSVKNLLVFLPLLASLRDRSWSDVEASVLVFVAFTALTSAVYIWNDLGDLDADRAHSRKRFRPLASGAISIPSALIVALLFAVGAFVLAIAIDPLVAFAIGVYLVGTILYSAYLKRVLVADVVVLACLYIARVLAGCAALHIVPSVWLLLYCAFLFFSLALMKRCAELSRESDVSRNKRGYIPADRTMLFALGATSGVASALVFGLYIDSLSANRLYQAPVLLWLIVPLLLYWIARAWILTNRGWMHDDPVVFALRDRASIVTGALVIVIAIAAVVVQL